MRLIHAAGDPAIVGDLHWTEDVVAAGRRALASGAPILVDSEMVAAGIIRARLPACDAVLCTLGEPGVVEAARAMDTTRSAAAVDRWRDKLEGALVAIGNAPTALFHLLEMLDAGAPRPAAILGFPGRFRRRRRIEGGADRASGGRAVRHPARPSWRQRVRRGRRQRARRRPGVSPWLTVVGIGDDGLAGLSPSARALVETAELLVGGERHQGMVPDTRCGAADLAGRRTSRRRAHCPVARPTGGRPRHRRSDVVRWRRQHRPDLRAGRDDSDPPPRRLQPRRGPHAVAARRCRVRHRARPAAPRAQPAYSTQGSRCWCSAAMATRRLRLPRCWLSAASGRAPSACWSTWAGPRSAGSTARRTNGGIRERPN